MVSPKKKFSPKTLFSQKNVFLPKHMFSWKNILKKTLFHLKTYFPQKTCFLKKYVFTKKKTCFPPKKLDILGFKKSTKWKKIGCGFYLWSSFFISFSVSFCFFHCFPFFPLFHPVNSSNLTPWVWQCLPWPCFSIIIRSDRISIH